MRDTITLSLPNAMTRQVEQACRREHRTKSELMREALRVYSAPRAACRPIRPPSGNWRLFAEVAKKSAAATIIRSMSSTPRWKVITADRAQKSLARMPERERARLLRAIDEMAVNPFAGDF
jgi:ribbon-helix-helix CopG family protein